MEQNGIINSAERAVVAQEFKPGEMAILSSGMTISGMATVSGMALDALPEREIAYSVLLPAYGEFMVVKSPNAWWMDTKKVAVLFDAYKNRATDEIACTQANISIGQLRYFRNAHPDFLQAKEGCKSVADTRFLNGLNNLGPSDLPTIRWYLGKTHEDFKGESKDKVVPLTAIQQNADLIINQNVDTGKIAEAIAGALREIAHDRAREGTRTDRSGQGVEALGSPDRV